MAAVMDMLKSKLLFPILTALCVLLLVGIVMPRGKIAAVFCRFPEQTLIIDAGHGGEDGGAVSVSGTPESSINLLIALKTDQLCGLFGVQSKLVRSEDTSLADSNADTLRKKKHTDLINRTAMVNDTPNAVLLSIHQNNYVRSSSRGAQVFYHKDVQSQKWAVQMQELLRKSLDETNNRQATEIPDTVYLINHVNCQAVLVECGFLSNPEENQLLESDGYQSKIAAVLLSSYLQHFDL